MIKKIIYLSIVIPFLCLSFKNLSDGINSKRDYLTFKKIDKKVHKIKVFNQIENVPISLEDFRIKYNIKKPVKKYFVVKIEKLIEPDKIAEPTQLPEPVVIKIDTPKFKSKIQVSKAP